MNVHLHIVRCTGHRKLDVSMHVNPDIIIRIIITCMCIDVCPSQTSTPIAMVYESVSQYVWT